MLPLSEEAEPAADDNLFKMEDVRIEVMRSRGAGGQVRVRTRFDVERHLTWDVLSMSTKLSRPYV